MLNPVGVDLAVEVSGVAILVKYLQPGAIAVFLKLEAVVVIRKSQAGLSQLRPNFGRFPGELRETFGCAGACIPRADADRSPSGVRRA